MKKDRTERSRRRSGRRIVFFLLALALLSGVLLLRWMQAQKSGTEPEEPGPSASLSEEPQNSPEPNGVQNEGVPKEARAEADAAGKADGSEEATSPPPASQESGNPAAAVQPQDAVRSDDGVSASGIEADGTAGRTAVSERRANPYTETTYQLVTDLVYTRRQKGEEGEEEIRRLLTELKEEDPELGEMWQGIMDYWAYVSGELTVNIGMLPEGLTGDDSLCLVVLGFQLMPNGSMAPELLGRCETALACARQYPNAVLAVTGGGTASGNREATEAGVMADWFVSKGIDRERILVEDRSLTTDQNASFTCALLASQAPQVRELAVISSDYHVGLGCLLFTEASLLYGYQNGCPPPWQVVSNAGFATSGSPEYSDPRRFGADIWVLADPTY